MTTWSIKKDFIFLTNRLVKNYMAPKTSEQFKEIRKESRTKILVAALELFAVDGYHNTSISKIAKHASISKGLMYNYFESKEDLLKDVVVMSLEDGLQMVEQMQEQIIKMHPKEILQFSIEIFFKMLKENKTMWKLTFSLAMQITNMPHITEMIRKIFQNVLVQFEMILKINGFTNYKTEAKLLAAQLDGISMHYLIFEKTYNLEEIKNTLIKKYCNDKK